MVNLLRQFNKQSQRLVLGGQAVHSQVLKKINAMHIALCCQCCSFVEALLPGLQELLQPIFQEHGPEPSPSGLLGELARIGVEYAEHRLALLDKLSDILRERYEVHAKKWLATPHPDPRADNWNEVGDGSQGVPWNLDLNPHTAMEGLTKDFTAMYNVLSKNLSGEYVQKIYIKAFMEVAVKFEHRVMSGVPAPSPPYEDVVGRTLGDRLALDAAFIQDQLEKLTGIALPLRRLLCEFVHHLRTKLPVEDLLRRLNPSVIEALLISGKLPR